MCDVEPIHLLMDVGVIELTRHETASYGLVGFLHAGSPEPNVNFVWEFRERASLFMLDVGELDHLGPRSSATQIGKSNLCRFPASPKYDRYGFR
jgi:hypothetical protein